MNRGHDTVAVWSLGKNVVSRAKLWFARGKTTRQKKNRMRNLTNQEKITPKRVRENNLRGKKKNGNHKAGGGGFNLCGIFQGIPWDERINDMRKGGKDVCGGERKGRGLGCHRRVV